MKPKRPVSNRLTTAGALSFFLWGVLHVYAGLLTALPFVINGPGANLGIFGITAEESPLSANLTAASHVVANFGFDSAGYGVLAIWLARLVWQDPHARLSFWILVVMLGIADAAFIYSLLLPGYSPLLEGIAGPILYVLGVVLTGFGMKNERTKVNA